jgi:hypothetical protein
LNDSEQLTAARMATKLVTKVLGYRKSQRYIIERILHSAWNELIKDRNDINLEIVEVRQVADILKYTPVFAYASVGRCPTRAEVVVWMEDAIKELTI